MSLVRLRAAGAILAAGLGLSACTHYDGYGYGGVSVGYSSGDWCDPYWDDCYYGSRFHDPWWGWHGDYFYPGIGIFVYDRWGRRHHWSDDHRRFWEGRRHRWRDRDWNDRRWERWDGFRDRRRWDRDDRREWRRDRGEWREDRGEMRENWRDFRRDRRGDNREFREDWREDRQRFRRGEIDRDQLRQERREDRREFRQERRQDRRELRRENRRDRRD